MSESRSGTTHADLDAVTGSVSTSASRRPERIGLLPLSVLIFGAIAAVAWIATLIYGFERLIAWLL
jgi:hypothetical protein